MRKMLYARIAFDNLRKNHRIYLPYLLTCMGAIMMFYILCALTFGNMIGEQFAFGEATLKSMLSLGIWVVGLFSLIFLFYTNSFLTKRRKKEFGLYNILGMEKRHIARVMLYETVYAALISLAAGLAGGILLSKLMALFVMRLLRVEGGATFAVPPRALLITVCLFGAIFLLTYVSALFTIRLSSPAELLRGGQVGEKEPKSRWLLAVLGVLLLGGGYYLAVVTTNPLEALLYFFVAVILVILGTYCLFTAGSVVFLKLLRKNKGYYYQTRHFISVSGMIYRMKQNAVGLANICILSTMVLVMLSSTISLYAGVRDAVERDLPGQITVTALDGDQAALEEMRRQSAKLLEEKNLRASWSVGFRCLPVAAMRDGSRFIEDRSYTGGEIVMLCFIPQSDIPEALDGRILQKGQALVQADADYREDSLTAFGQTFSVVGSAALNFVGREVVGSNGVRRMAVVVPDEETFYALDSAQKAAYPDASSEIHCVYAFDMDADEALQADIATELSGRVEDATVQSAVRRCQDAYQVYGSLFFLGLFLGTLFTMATVLIMYYKQMSEGYDDRKRFQIMRSVGLDQAQIKRAIKSQVLTVFFLPLVTAAVHIAFAFPMIVRMFSVLALTNVRMFALTTLGAVILFAIFYAGIYALTARTYYRIVSD